MKYFKIYIIIILRIRIVIDSASLMYTRVCVAYPNAEVPNHIPFAKGT